jgi:hypothetical protein
MSENGDVIHFLRNFARISERFDRIDTRLDKLTTQINTLERDVASLGLRVAELKSISPRCKVGWTRWTVGLAASRGGWSFVGVPTAD